MSTIITPKFSTSNFQSSFQKNLNGFRDSIIVYWIFFLVLIWDWMIGWIRLLTTLCGVHSLTCVTLVCLSCEISVLCFINQGPQCRLVLLFNFLRNPEEQKEFGVPRAILFHQYSYCSELLKKFELEIFFYWYQRVFPSKPIHCYRWSGASLHPVIF